MEDQILERDYIFQNGNTTFSVATKGELNTYMFNQESQKRFASAQPSNSHIHIFKTQTQDKQLPKKHKKVISNGFAEHITISFTICFPHAFSGVANRCWHQLNSRTDPEWLEALRFGHKDSQYKRWLTCESRMVLRIWSTANWASANLVWASTSSSIWLWQFTRR